MTRKLTCTQTGNWSYCSEERWQKLVARYGSESELEANYVSRQGKKVQAGETDAPDAFKNKIACTVTGELCYCSPGRLARLIEKAGSEEEVRRTYMSRVAKRLIAEGKSEDEVRKMASDGKLPAPTAEKTEEAAPMKQAAKSAPAKKAAAKKTVAKKTAKKKVAAKKTAAKKTARKSAAKK